MRRGILPYGTSSFAYGSRRVAVIVAAVMALLWQGFSPAWAQEDAEPDERSSLESLQQDFRQETAIPESTADLVELETRVSKRPVRSGEDLKAAVFAEIAEGWHVNAHRPLQEFLIGTSLEIEPHERIVVADVRYPDPDLARFDFADEELAVYEGETPIFISLRTSEAAPAGLDSLSGRLRVQACNDQICLQPSTISVAIPVEFSGSSGASSPQHSDLFAAYDAGSRVQTLVDNDVARLFSERGALLAFIGIFIIGLALNLTPCVYPMLSVTVSLFGTNEASNMWDAFGRAAVYVLGIASMYTVLGTVASFTGSLFGGILQSPWVQAGVGVLLVGLAMSMLGLYEIRLPAGLTTKLGRAHGVAGPLGLFLSGLVVGVFAAPCIGPPVIALLAFVGAKGDPLFGSGAFLTLSLGLGLPYLILGTFSGLLNRLPRSGSWMIWVKRVFAVVLIGAGLFYFGLAFAPAHAFLALPITLVGAGIFLAVWNATSSSTGVAPRLAWVLGAGLILLGILAFRGLQKPGVDWQPYSPELVEAAKTAGRPVMLDFYADWCIPCLELDRITFTDREVVEEAGSFTTLKVDLTQFDSPESEELRRTFGVAGVPTIVLLDASGQEVREERTVGYVPPKVMLTRLRSVASRSTAQETGSAVRQ